MRPKEELLGLIDQIRSSIATDKLKVIDYSYQFNTGYTEVCDESKGVVIKKPDIKNHLTLNITFITNSEVENERYERSGY